MENQLLRLERGNDYFKLDVAFWLSRLKLFILVRVSCMRCSLVTRIFCHLGCGSCLFDSGTCRNKRGRILEYDTFRGNALDYWKSHTTTQTIRILMMKKWVDTWSISLLPAGTYRTVTMYRAVRDRALQPSVRRHQTFKNFFRSVVPPLASLGGQIS